MKIGVASGKGGTGKTTVATALALSLEGPLYFADCDVEAPNANIFLKVQLADTRDVFVPVPVFESNLCSSCGECAKVCRFNAVAALGRNILIFPELCHGCGACLHVCRSGALKESSRKIGVIESGKKENISFARGVLDVGEAMSPPLIKELVKSLPDEGLCIVDCPPGTSCPLVAAVRELDFVLLVAEPSPFGLNDLSLTVETLRELRLPFAVIQNRLMPGDTLVEEYCRAEGIKILMNIPFSRAAAEACSRGENILGVMPGLEKELAGLPSAIGEILG